MKWGCSIKQPQVNMIIEGTFVCHANFAYHLNMFSRQVPAAKHCSIYQLTSLGAECCANYCMTPPSISVLMEIHNLWHILFSASGDPNAIISLKWDLIGQLLSQLLLWSLISSNALLGCVIVQQRQTTERHSNTTADPSLLLILQTNSPSVKLPTEYPPKNTAHEVPFWSTSCFKPKI